MSNFCAQEIEKAWKMVDAAHEKETRAKETIQGLKFEISNLSKLVEQGAGLSMGQDNKYESHDHTQIGRAYLVTLTVTLIPTLSP